MDRTQEFAARLTGILNSNIDPELAKVAWEHGETWYRDANAFAMKLAATYGITLEQACGIMAATSIRTRWAANLADSVLACSGLLRTGLKLRYQKCNAILASDDTSLDAVLSILRGPKIRAFAQNIYNPDGREATIDVWMCRAFDVPHKDAKGETYDQMQRAVQMVADGLNIPVPTLQAVVWVMVRGSAD